jgi:hypothetical protein
MRGYESGRLPVNLLESSILISYLACRREYVSARKPLSDDYSTGDRTLLGRYERNGATCLNYDHAMAILPSVLNPVFEIVTGEAPASFSLSPRPDETRTC